ncbi:hypothetical protein ABFT23_06095 [Nocardioides sp. C4-1]|uniref:hypothetical protein n=1 Tax=Nocardioides sp. C4-1 TaxID=3151851 RepID=UPI003263B348
MNGIDDLRRTLQHHADEALAGPDDHVGRRRAVHERARATRRRRRGVAAGVVASLVAAAGVAVVVAPDGRGNAGPADLVGVDVPETLTALGFTYHYAGGLEGERRGDEGRVDATLEGSSRDRLISWGTSGDDDRVVVKVDGRTLTHDDPDFTNWTLVPAGTSGPVSATVAEGRPALAVYELGDETPDGVSLDGSTFRQDVAGAELLAAEFVDGGPAEVTLDATATTNAVRVHLVCSGGPDRDDDDSEELVLQRDPLGQGEVPFEPLDCSGSLPVDATTAPTPLVLAASSRTTTPGDAVSITYRVTTWSGEVVDDPGFRLGVAMYALADREPANGASPELEADGHRWVLAETVDGGSSTKVEYRAPSDGGARFVTTIATGEEVVYVDGRDRQAEVLHRIGLADHWRYAGSRSEQQGLLGPGEEASLQVVEGGSAALMIAVYERDD